MAKTIKSKEEATDTSKNFLNSLLNGYSEDIYNDIQNKPYKISTGSIILDSYVNIQSGSCVRLVGPTSSGKSSQALLLMNNYLDTVPKSKGVYIKSESRLSDEMKKRSKAKMVFNAEEWEEGTIFCLETNIFDTICQILESLLENSYDQGIHLVICLDSLDGCILKGDLDSKSVSDGVKVAGVPLMTKLLFKRLALPINKYNSLFIITSQISANIQLNPYDKSGQNRIVDSAGGNSINHQCDVILSYGPRYNGDLILENEDEKPDMVKNKIIGHKVNVTIKKSNLDVTGTVCSLAIKRGFHYNGFWLSKEVGDMILAWELAKKNKSTFEFNQDILNQAKEDKINLQEKIVGKNNFYRYLEDNKDICDWFYKKISSVVN